MRCSLLFAVPLPIHCPAAQVKKGPLQETSPMLVDISGIPMWSKVRPAACCFYHGCCCCCCWLLRLHCWRVMPCGLPALLYCHVPLFTLAPPHMPAELPIAWPCPTRCTPSLLARCLCCVAQPKQTALDYPTHAYQHQLTFCSAGEQRHGEDVPGRGAGQVPHHAALPVRLAHPVGPRAAGSAPPL